MTTKSVFVECNRETTTSNIYSDDYHRWRTTLTEPFSIKKGDQLRMNMAVLSLLGTGDYLELTDDDILGEEVVINPYADLNQQTKKTGTGLRAEFYYNNNSRGKGNWFEYGTNPPIQIPNTLPLTTFDNKDYYCFRQQTTTHSINHLDGWDSVNSDLSLKDILTGYNYDSYSLNANVSTGSSKIVSEKSGFCRCKTNFKILNIPNEYSGVGNWTYGYVDKTNVGTYLYNFIFYKSGVFDVVYNGQIETSGIWEQGDRFKISRRMYGVYFKQMKHDHEFNTEALEGRDGNNSLDYYTLLYHKDIRSQIKIDAGLYDNEWDEPEVKIKLENNTIDSVFKFGSVKHNLLREYLRTDGLKWGNPKILHKRDDDGFFTHYQTGERITTIDKNESNPAYYYYGDGLGAIDNTAFYTNFLFDLTPRLEDWIQTGFYSESDIATRITEQLNNSKGYYPHTNTSGVNPTGAKGLITNGLLWMYNETDADDTAEYVFVDKYWYSPLPEPNNLHLLYFPPKRSLVGATSPVVIYNDAISRFEIQYLHAPYKIQSGTDKGQDTLIMCCNTGSWDGSSLPKNITREFLDRFGGIGLHNFINIKFWRKLGFDTTKAIYNGGYFTSTQSDMNLSYNASLKQYKLPDEAIAQPDEDVNNNTDVKFVDAKSSALRASFLPVKVEFPYFLMLSNLPISGVGNKFYANDGGVYNCLGHIKFINLNKDIMSSQYIQGDIREI